MDPQKEYQVVKQMAERYNTGEIDLPDHKLEKLARLTAKHGIEFRVKSRPISKGLFDMTDMATFGMVPNKWRPESIGQQYHGESSSDRVAGGLGSLLGLATGVGVGIRGGRALWAGRGAIKDVTGAVYSKTLGKAVGKVKETEAARRASELARTMYNKGDNVIGFGSNPYRIDFSNLRLMP